MLRLIGFVCHSGRRRVKDAEVEDEPVERFERFVFHLSACIEAYNRAFTSHRSVDIPV
jgi:hypothetical protein